MNRFLCLGWVLAGLVLAGCSSDGDVCLQDHDIPVVEDRNAIDIVTRTEGSETNGSTIQAGLYMVNYANGQQVELNANDNYVNNLLMNYAYETWVPSAPIYWLDTNVNADFYAYAPYIEQVNDARAMTIRVATDQTSDDAFMNSDFLWGIVQGQSPLAGRFNLMLTHQLSQLTVAVTHGDSFSDGELATENVSVSIGGSMTLGIVDLQTGIVTATGDRADVRCRNNGDLTYTAILLPQQIPFANFIKVEWNGNSYILQNSFKLEAKKQYKLAIRLNKTQGGLDVGIIGWDINDEDFGGTVG